MLCSPAATYNTNLVKKKKVFYGGRPTKNKNGDAGFLETVFCWF